MNEKEMRQGDIEIDLQAIAVSAKNLTENVEHQGSLDAIEKIVELMEKIAYLELGTGK